MIRRSSLACLALWMVVGSPAAVPQQEPSARAARAGSASPAKEVVLFPFDDYSIPLTYGLTLRPDPGPPRRRRSTSRQVGTGRPAHHQPRLGAPRRRRVSDVVPGHRRPGCGSLPRAPAREWRAQRLGAGCHLPGLLRHQQGRHQLGAAGARPRRLRRQQAEQPGRVRHRQRSRHQPDRHRGSRRPRPGAPLQDGVPDRQVPEPGGRRVQSRRPALEGVHRQPRLQAHVRDPWARQVQRGLLRERPWRQPEDGT